MLKRPRASLLGWVDAKPQAVGAQSGQPRASNGVARTARATLRDGSRLRARRRRRRRRSDRAKSINEVPGAANVEPRRSPRVEAGFRGQRAGHGIPTYQPRSAPPDLGRYSRSPEPRGPRRDTREVVGLKSGCPISVCPDPVHVGPEGCPTPHKVQRLPPSDWQPAPSGRGVLRLTAEGSARPGGVLSAYRYARATLR